MMEYHSVGPGGVMVSGNNVPAFLTKLWTLVEDPDTDPLICWSPSGNSFHVFDQGRFSKEVLPKYFKHNNMASFVRQLNMYGFRKVVHIEQGGLVKPEKDDTEFQHPYFIRGQEHLLENIKRKVTTVSNIKHEDFKLNSEEMSKMITDVQSMKGKQESMDSKISTLKHENEGLWREVAILRQKHAQQQKVVNKLIQFLITLARSNRVLGVKRKMPLMLNDGSSTHSMPKYSRQYSLESSPSLSPSSTAFTGTGVFTSESPVKTGPIISDITELAQSNPEATEEWIEDRTSPLVHVKEEPSSPAHSPEVEEVCPVEVEVEVGSGVPVDMPLSPITFINSILQESEPVTGLTPPPNDQKCLSLACLDNYPQMSEISRLFSSFSASSLHLRPHSGAELSDHLETIDSGLDSLQHILNAQSINFETSPFFDIFTSSSIDMDLDSLASIQDLLSPEPVKETESGDSENSGKQLVQYTSQPVILPDPVSTETSATDLPMLLELEGDSYFGSEPAEDLTISFFNFQSPVPEDPKLS
ncbi:heat shock factor protein 1-like isoform X1 [Sinocyclocheilus anshuiensis]|uniref:Heat shock factor protein 1-like n=1 Tax=Sinocyclocheilus anshuiensis TaxID=1608454 RepID=A0A671Q179_9TELE|nr:PREDICTED: heat shock factor protein 1-like isoform X1 [Sinocyclocheilus anshuiensis]